MVAARPRYRPSTRRVMPNAASRVIRCRSARCQATAATGDITIAATLLRISAYGMAFE